MRKSLGMAMLATVVGLGLASSAQAEDAATSSSYGQGGLTVKSGANEMKISSVFQTRMTVVDSHDGGSPNANEGDSVSFGIRRFKTSFAGKVFDDKWSYKATLAWNSENTGRMIETGYVGYKLSDAVKLHMGRTKLAFNLEEMTSSSRQTFADRSAANEAFNNDFATGLWASGAQEMGEGSLTWNAGLYNGNLRNNAGQNRDFGGNARTDFMINLHVGYRSGYEDITKYMSDLRAEGDRELAWYVGLGLNSQDLNNGEIALSTVAGNNDSATVNSLAFDARVHVEGFSVNFAYFMRSISVDREDEDLVGSSGGTSASGFNLTAGYNMDKLEVAARYSSVNDDDHGGAIGSDTTEFGLGANYRFNKDKLKATFDVNYTETDAHGVGTGVVPAWGVRFQVQLKF